MPSIFTLSGVDEPRKPKRARKPRKRKGALGEVAVGYCKDVFNSRTKKTASLCFVGKGDGPGQSRSGWLFRSKKG